jgi:uncharacterized membrane protein
MSFMPFKPFKPFKSPRSTDRFDAIDALRGCAILWMAVFHFCYDLNYFGHIKQNFISDPIWTWQRTAIVSVFLFCAGLGQSVAYVQGQTWARFWRRWAQVAGCALLVTAGSWWMFPRSYIYFGVLHGMAVMLIVVRLTAGMGQWLWLLGALAIALKYIAFYVHSISGSMGLSMELLNTKSLNWLGLVSYKPRTEDYVPVFPWLGVMWWGMACGVLVQRRAAQWLATLKTPTALSTLGRWSLSFYMLHQPVLMAVLGAVQWCAGLR